MADAKSDLLAASDGIIVREADRLPQEITEMRTRIALHEEILEALRTELAGAERVLREIEELNDRSAQLRLERLDRELRGRRLQEVAVEILRRERGPDEVVHYREWFALVRSEGFQIVGRDPVNNFLTAVGRADGVERVGERTGLYRLA